MIVRTFQKILKTGIYSQRSLMWFSNNSIHGLILEGFKKFDRKNKNKQVNTPLNNQSSKEEETEDQKNQFKDEQNINIKQTKIQKKGFNRFQMKRNNENDKEHDQKDQLSKMKEQQKNDINQPKNRFKKFEMKRDDKFQVNNQKDQFSYTKDEQGIGKKKTKGFNKFSRKNESQNHHKFQANQSKQKPQIKKTQDKSFEGEEQKNQSKQEENQMNIKDQQKVDEQIKPSKNEQNFTPKGFNKFTENTSKQVDKSQKEQNEQEIKKKREQEQLRRKEEYFLLKLLQYKQAKQYQEQANSLYQPYRQFLRMFKADANVQPPKKYQLPALFQNNPTFYSYYLYYQMLKPLIFLALLFVLYKKYLERETDKIEAQPVFMLESIQNGTALHFLFEEQEEETGSEKGNKMNHYVVMVSTQNLSYKCVANEEFKDKIIEQIEKYKMNTGKIISYQYVIKKKQKLIVFINNVVKFAFLIFFLRILGQMSSQARQRPGKNTNFDLQGFSKSKRFSQKINIKFNDVVGMQRAKQEIVEFIDFLMNPAKYNELGAKIPRGALLTGPPGTGKTMIAKACAGESNVPFFTISGSQFMEMYVGVGAQRVRDLFKEAKESAPSIIFIDEIDAIGKKRASGFGGGNDERDNTLNQMLVEMDGFDTNSNVIVFAATNQKDVLDPALTRPGRFDRLIEVDLPDIQGRKEIFLIYLKKIVLDSEIAIEEYARRMATLTPGFSGAEIKNLCNEAAIVAARDDKKFVSLLDFELATQRIIGGVEKKSSLITPETRKTVAYHECGHGVVSWFMQGANPLLKLTIIPRSKGALGFAQYLPNENQISSRKQLEDQICVILGGRISEEIFFKKISTGAYDDLQKAYQLAKAIVAQYGMNEKLGWLGYNETQYAKYYSQATEKQIDQQITKIISKCTERTRSLINEKRNLIEALAEKLLEKQTIDQVTIESILGERPFKASKQYEQYLKERKQMQKQKQTQKQTIKASQVV